jgi:hypothetical protein
MTRDTSGMARECFDFNLLRVKNMAFRAFECPVLLTLMSESGTLFGVWGDLRLPTDFEGARRDKSGLAAEAK